MPIAFTGSAIDPESGDLVRRHHLDLRASTASLGVGASFSRSDLSLGVHTVTAQVSDGQGGVAHARRVAHGLRAERTSCSRPATSATAPRAATRPPARCSRRCRRHASSRSATSPTRDGSAQDFASCFDPELGPHKARIRPVAGNHEYESPDAQPYFAYFGAAAATRAQAWHSFDLSGWHVVALNCNCADVGRLRARARRRACWLEADLATNSKPCTLALIHHSALQLDLVGRRRRVAPVLADPLRTTAST